MLFYKAWRESRLGFLLSVFALALVCALYFYSIHHRPDPVHRYTDLQKTYLVVYHGAVRNIFIVLTLLLGLGGLLRERAHKTLEFTLALPVSRRRIVLARAAIGLAEMVVLALTPAFLVPALSAWSHLSYPTIAQSLRFAVIWTACGAIFFAAGFLLSTFVPGDYPAATACLIALFAYLMVLNLDFAERFQSLDLLDVMGAFHMPYFSGRDTCFVAYLPWGTLSFIVLIGFAIIALAAQIVERQDF